jgi:NAD(P)-dependent dehydrogenase (short-subunit alcohol dehydrogenase family)
VVRVARALPPGADFLDLPADLTDAAEVEALAERVRGEVGPPDVVVSNAGGFLLRPLERTTVADFDAQVAINLRAAFAVARAFLPMLRDAGRGCFVTVGSVADHVGFPENAAYAASKYGLRGLHETLLAEFRGTGVRLTLVSPGPTDTDIWAPFDPDRREGFPRRAEMLRPADVADAVLFVATRPPHVLVDWLRLGPI